VDCNGRHRPVLWNTRASNMIILTLEENQILENDHEISNLPAYLKRLPPKSEITLVIKSHDALYYFCPIKKAVPFVISAEYSIEYWVGERHLPKGETFIGGILPTPFMRSILKVISDHSIPVKGAYLWTDLITKSYGPFDPGWTMIWHNHHLLICEDGILRLSRPCYQPLANELPAILRYLKRFGYQEEMPITLLKSSLFPDPLPLFMNAEIRIPNDLVYAGIVLSIPELKNARRLYSWPRQIKVAAYAIAFLNTIGIGYFSLKIKSTNELERALITQISQLPASNHIDEKRVETLAAFHHLTKDRPNILPLLRQLMPILRDAAVATHLQWARHPESLILHLELHPTTQIEPLLLTIRSELPNHTLTWKQAENDGLRGTLTIDKQVPNQEES
jgi:hypothetical protein